MHWLALAPANIALIKYMGKKDKSSNLPENSSLSYTLNDMLSTVKLECIPGRKDLWEPLNIPGAADFSLSLAGQKRFLDHLIKIKEYFGYDGSFLVQSNTNFPQGSGLASSASSFAALTKCAVQALSELTHKALPSIAEQAALSRLGSGSSCRSFYSPWALWADEGVEAITLPYMTLIHQAIIISNKEKEVSSSEAHARVKTSSHYALRVHRAKDNLKTLLDAFNAQDWENAYHTCWREFQDMHNLFSTCDKPFTYMTQETHALLDILQQSWKEIGDGPLVTMDAGPNIHLLYRPNQADMARQFKQDYLIGNYDVL